MKRFRSNFFIYTAIATAILTLVDSIFVIQDLKNLDNGWMITRIYCLILFFGAIISIRLARIILSNSLFFTHLVLTVIATGFMILLAVSQATNLTWVVKFWNLIHAKTGFDMEIFILFFIYYFLLGITGILLLVKQKWLPGACLVVVTAAAVWVAVSYGPDSMMAWLTAIMGSISTAAWGFIAWWLYKENTEKPHSGNTGDDMTVNDPFNLNRFLTAQESNYPIALAELCAGKKLTHWMWFIFPQMIGLGYSAMSQRYAIHSREEAEAYLAHPVLGKRLLECANAVSRGKGRSISAIFGYPDDLKFHSSITLFAQVSEEDSIYHQLLEQYFAGELDARTLAILEK